VTGTVMASFIVSLVMDYMVLILVWCPYVASASASLLSTSFDKIEESQSTTSSRNNIIDSSIESSSHTDPLTRYLEGDNGTGQNKFDMNSRSMLLIWTAFCFAVFFFCCFRLILSNGRRQDAPGATSEAIREAIIANLSVDQRRAILEILFSDDTKFADTKNWVGKGLAINDANNYHDTTIDEHGRDNNIMMTTLSLLTPSRKSKFVGDKESPVTTLSQHTMSPSPDSSQHMVSLDNNLSPVVASVPMFSSGDPRSNEYESMRDIESNDHGSNKVLSIQPRLQFSVHERKIAGDFDADDAHPLSLKSTVYADVDVELNLELDVEQDCDCDVAKAETDTDDNTDSIEDHLCSICLDDYGK